MRKDQVEVDRQITKCRWDEDEFSKYDYRSWNVEVTKEELKKVRWDDILKPEFADTLEQML